MPLPYHTNYLKSVVAIKHDFYVDPRVAIHVVFSILCLVVWMYTGAYSSNLVFTMIYEQGNK